MKTFLDATPFEAFHRTAFGAKALSPNSQIQQAAISAQLDSSPITLDHHTTAGSTSADHLVSNSFSRRAMRSNSLSASAQQPVLLFSSPSPPTAALCTQASASSD
ncbi:hypothetical protein M0R45_036265 [Rubus argutus]|uniref:Uncharacterized protein n=1 Tax=Rubus argutus TaxID=59490 RepID=A0AAW1W0K1_RUBAR